MKKFLLNLLLVASITLLILVIAAFSTRYYVQNHADFHIDTTKHIVVFGDSHPECAINDSILSYWQNSAMSATQYFYIACTIDEYLSQNPQIDTVLIGVSVEKFHNPYDNVMDDPSYIQYRQPLLAFADIGDICRFAYKQPYYISAIYKLLYLPKVTAKTLGSYLYLERNDLHTDHDAVWNGIKQGGKDHSKIDHKNKHYLGEIINIVKREKRTLILFDAPVYHESEYWGEDARIELLEVLRSFGDTLYYADYHDFQLPDSCYGDIGHLNHQGATLFSTYLLNTPITFTTLPPNP